jgi:hypothetical protein
MMKNYKVDLSGYKGKVREALSVAIQHHAFELGYEWESFGKEAFWLKSSYLFFDENGRITHFHDEDETFFEAHSGDEISAADFLDFNPKESFKPFDKVLVRDFDSEEWSLDLFKEIDNNKSYKYQCLKSFYHQCIPYEGNEHLLGTDEPRG